MSKATCRRCAECPAGATHHWLTNSDFGNIEAPPWRKPWLEGVCKHCGTFAQRCGVCLGEGAIERGADGGATPSSLAPCAACGGEGYREPQYERGGDFSVEEVMVSKAFDATWGKVVVIGFVMRDLKDPEAESKEYAIALPSVYAAQTMAGLLEAMATYHHGAAAIERTHKTQLAQLKALDN